jgi:hypothetical protein
MPIELGTVAGSETLIRDLYIDLRKKINQWAELTKQTAQARMGYVGQHLVSVATGYHGGRSGARGHDLIIPEHGFGEIKTCYRVDQLGKCNACGKPVASIELECSYCDSQDIHRNDDSKWLISMSHEKDLSEILDPYRYYLVLFDFTDLENPHTVRSSIWEVDPLAPGFAYCMIDYWYNIKAKSTSGAPFNLWPFQLKFDIMKPLLIYRSFISMDKITTEIFPKRNAPVLHPLQPLHAYSRSQNLKGERLTQLINELKFVSKIPVTKRSEFLAELHQYTESHAIQSGVIADALAIALYRDAIQPRLKGLPQGIKKRLQEGGLI